MWGTSHMCGTYHMRVYLFTHRYIQTQESERQGNKWDQPQSSSELPLNRNSRKRPMTSATLVNNFALWPWRGPIISPLPQNPLLVHLGEADPHLLRARLLPPQPVSLGKVEVMATHRCWDWASARRSAGQRPELVLLPPQMLPTMPSPQGSRKLSQLPFATVYYFLIDRWNRMHLFACGMIFWCVYPLWNG